MIQEYDKSKKIGIKYSFIEIYTKNSSYTLFEVEFFCTRQKYLKFWSAVAQNIKNIGKGNGMKCGKIFLFVDF